MLKLVCIMFTYNFTAPVTDTQALNNVDYIVS